MIIKTDECEFCILEKRKEERKEFKGIAYISTDKYNFSVRNFLIPRDFRYTQMPPSQVSKEEYYAWLTHHLMENDFELQPNQKMYFDQLKNPDPESMIVEFVFLCKHSKEIYEEEDQFAAQGLTFEQLYNLKFNTDDPKSNTYFIKSLLHYYKAKRLTEEEYEHIQRDIEQLGGKPYAWTYIDIPFRPILAQIIKLSRDREHAQLLIELFYHICNEDE